MSVKGKRLGFLGCGNMGEALVKGLVEAHVLPAEAIIASDTRTDRLTELERQYGIRVAKDNVTSPVNTAGLKKKRSHC